MYYVISYIIYHFNILCCVGNHSRIGAKLCRKDIGIEGGGQDEALSSAATGSTLWLFQNMSK